METVEFEEPFVLPRDPRRRRDGLCSYCKGERKLPARMVVALSVYARDVFCTRTCCEAWHTERAATLATRNERDAA